MISLLILDHPGFWTPAVNWLKYSTLIVCVVAGLLLCVRSRLVYSCTVLLLAQMPLGAVMQYESMYGKQSTFAVLSYDNHFAYMWLEIALLETFLIWVPLVAEFVRHMRTAIYASTMTQPNPTVETDAHEQSDARRSP